MARQLDEDALRCLALFEEVTGIEAVDCLIDEDHDRVAFVVPSGEIAAAIGPEGRTVDDLERRLGRDVHLVEMADRVEDFVANALRPAAVYDVIVDDGIATVEVAEGDRGAAIGADGHRVDLARRLGTRHFDLDDVRLT